MFRILLLLLLVPTVAFANPLKLTASSRGSFVELTFENVSKRSVTMTTHVRAGLLDHHDWLTVKLAGKATRAMTFVETRTRAIPVAETIAPGKSITRSVDLAVWAVHGENREPLAPGTYDVEATWDTTSESSGPKLKLVAKTKLVIAAPIEKPCKEAKPSKTGIEVLARQIGSTTTIEVGLHNHDKVAHCVSAYIATHEQQSDWLTLHIDGKTPRKLVLNDSRDKSAEIAVELPPGATHWLTWDVGAWAKRSVNGNRPLASGSSWMSAVYDSTRQNGRWRGATKMSFAFKVP